MSRCFFVAAFAIQSEAVAGVTTDTMRLAWETLSTPWSTACLSAGTPTAFLATLIKAYARDSENLSRRVQYTKRLGNPRASNTLAVSTCWMHSRSRASSRRNLFAAATAFSSIFRCVSCMTSCSTAGTRSKIYRRHSHHYSSTTRIQRPTRRPVYPKPPRPVVSRRTPSWRDRHPMAPPQTADPQSTPTPRASPPSHFHPIASSRVVCTNHDLEPDRVDPAQDSEKHVRKT